MRKRIKLGFLLPLVADDGSLPKTNMMNDSHLYWAGVGTLFFLIILWKRKNQKENQKQTKNKQKVGIIT